LVFTRDLRRRGGRKRRAIGTEGIGQKAHQSLTDKESRNRRRKLKKKSETKNREINQHKARDKRRSS